METETKKYETVPADVDLAFLNAEEVARALGCSLPLARQTMRSKGFPLIRVGKNYRVMRSAFVKWASERRC